MKRREFLGGAATVPFLVPLIGCGGGGDGSPTDPSSPGPGTIPTGLDLPDLPRLADNAGPGTFQSSITAARANVQFAPGVNTEVWAYNGVVPGPLIVLHEGDDFRVTFTNSLSQPSNIHWHGLPVPPEMDGNPMDVIQPGGSFTYAFRVLPGTAGTYWFHPHPHHTSHEQFFRGLTGMIIVRSPDDPIPGDIQEKHLFVTDLGLDGAGAIRPNSEGDALNGREGNHVLVNGRKEPVIRIRPGASQRWRIVNAASARPLRLALQGHTFIVIGTDGGLLQSPVAMGELFLAPAERAEVIVTANQSAGTNFALVALPYDRQKIVNPGASAQLTVATLSYTSESPAASTPLPAVLRPIGPLGSPRAVQHATFTQSAPQGAVIFGINGKLFDPNRVDVVASLGDVEEWEVTNLAGMDHPFHLHGGQFQVISRTRLGTTRPEPFLAWKDTFNLVGGETVRFRMVQEFPGIRVFHCHIMEHESHGMMGTVQVA
jgi:FtsP/CotA-like multicopper oxidase with cupredoxin domain